MLKIEKPQFTIWEENNLIKMNVTQQGATLKDLDAIIRKEPRIKLTNFAVLKTVLSNPSEDDVEIGFLLPPVELEITSDEMTAYIIVHELDKTNEHAKEQFQEAIKEILANEKITYGINEIDFNVIRLGKPFEIATGTPPQKGEDAIINYRQLPDRKPIITEEGKADYYDMNFLEEVVEGDWLGDKESAKEGIPGKTIKGNVVDGIPGDDKQFSYDQNSIEETIVNGKPTLIAKKSGVLEMQHGIICVNDTLIISGDVGPETGNLKVNGAVIIKGTVLSGFSVVASGDISIEGKDGVFNAKEIRSTAGDIFIKGGIFGKGESVVYSENNIYLKHSNETTLFAKKDINVGYYLLGSNVQATNVLLDPRKGKIIGGETEAVFKIETGYSGNHLERKTLLTVTGVNTLAIQDELKIKAENLKNLQVEISDLQRKLSQLDAFREKLTSAQTDILKETETSIVAKEEIAKSLDEDIQKLLAKMRNTAKPQITVHIEAHPGTVFQIGHKSKSLFKSTKGTFLIENGEINI